MQTDKCNFLRKEVIYLGHKITKNGVSSGSEKIKIIKKYPMPHDVSSLQRFVGFVRYYRKFMKDFQKIVIPLTQLTS